MDAEIKGNKPAEGNGMTSSKAPAAGVALNGAAMNPFQDKREDALYALQQSENLLRQHAAGGVAPAVDGMLRLIDLAKAAGVTGLVTPVGYRDSRGCGAEFGSTCSSWRIGGAIPATKVALSVTYQYCESGNSFVSLAVSLPEPVSAFGMTSNRFEACLILFPKKGAAQFRVKSPADAVDKGDTVEEMERVFKFSTKSAPAGGFNWTEYAVAPTGVVEVKRK